MAERNAENLQKTVLSLKHQTNLIKIDLDKLQIQMNELHGVAADEEGPSRNAALLRRTQEGGTVESVPDLKQQQQQHGAQPSKAGLKSLSQSRNRAHVLQERSSCGVPAGALSGTATAGTAAAERSLNGTASFAATGSGSPLSGSLRKEELRFGLLQQANE